MSRGILERDGELSALADAVQAAASGDGSAVLIHGEAGIGKSSLVDALRARLPAEVALRLLGRAIRHAVGESPLRLARLEALYDLFPNAPRASAGYVVPPDGPGLGLEFDEAEARKRPSRDARLPQRYWPDGSVADY